MKCEYIKTFGTWRDVADSCNTTIHKEHGNKEPSSSWKKKILLSEHSPIRQLSFKFKWIDIPYWVSVHLVRHKIGIEHFVRTQRTDRTGVNRDEIPQGALVEHEIVVNTQAMITISRKRLCKCASNETSKAWKILLETIKVLEPELYDVCVPECVYRGRCTEFKSCGYVLSKRYKEKTEKYIKK
jgi:hypothetical protein